MADIQKFIDKDGVSVLWSRVAAELKTKQSAIDAISSKANTNASDIVTMKNQIAALEEEAYDDTELRGLISTNTDNIAANTNALAILNGTGDGSVISTAAAEVAKVVANADTSFDTLKEIADWILNDTTGAASMANDISSLKELVGSESVAVQIANAIATALKIDGVDKYALASDLTALTTRVDENFTTSKKYADDLFTLIQPLTEEEIDAAIEAATTV